MTVSLMIPSDELKRTAQVAATLSRIAVELLDLAETAGSDELSSALIAEAKQLLGAVDDLSQAVESTAAANAAPGSLFGMSAASLGEWAAASKPVDKPLLRTP